MFLDVRVGEVCRCHHCWDIGRRTKEEVDNLAAKPKLLSFLDEPTSGLDSQSACATVSFLRTLADNGQAILCTCVTFHAFLVFNPNSKDRLRFTNFPPDFSKSLTGC